MVSVYVSGARVNSVDKINKIGQIEQVRDVHIKSATCPKVNDESIIDSWTMSQTAAAIVTGIATAKAMEAAKKQKDIAEDYYNLAKQQWDHFFNNYRPLEELELAEIDVEPHQVDYDKTIAGMTKSFASIQANKTDELNRLASQFCICLSGDTFRRQELASNTVAGDTDNFARRQEESRVRRLNERRFNRMLAAANRGRNMLSSSTSFASKANQFYGEYAQAISGLASGAANYLGYRVNRNKTKYNSAPSSWRNNHAYRRSQVPAGRYPTGSNIANGASNVDGSVDYYDNTSSVRINNYTNNQSFFDSYGFGPESLYGSQGTGGGIQNA